MKRGPPHYSTTKPQHYKKKGGTEMPNTSKFIVARAFTKEEKETLRKARGILNSIMDQCEYYINRGTILENFRGVPLDKLQETALLVNNLAEMRQLNFIATPNTGKNS